MTHFNVLEADQICSSGPERETADRWSTYLFALLRGHVTPPGVTLEDILNDNRKHAVALRRIAVARAVDRGPVSPVAASSLVRLAWGDSDIADENRDAVAQLLDGMKLWVDAAVARDAPGWEEVGWFLELTEDVDLPNVLVPLQDLLAKEVEEEMPEYYLPHIQIGLAAVWESLAKLSHWRRCQVIEAVADRLNAEELGAAAAKMREQIECEWARERSLAFRK